MFDKKVGLKCLHTIDLQEALQEEQGLFAESDAARIVTKDAEFHAIRVEIFFMILMSICSLVFIAIAACALAREGRDRKKSPLASRLIGD